jgi:hypothetical protein
MKILFFFYIALFSNSSFALILKTSYFQGDHVTNFGGSQIQATSALEVSGYAINLEHDFSSFYFQADLSMLNFQKNDPASKDLNEHSYDIYMGKKFGSPSNYLAFKVGFSNQQRVMGLVDGNNQVSFEKHQATSVVGGIRINSTFLSYDFDYHNYSAVSVNKSTLKGKMVIHNVALNLGNKLKYGLFYSAQRIDLSGDLIQWRSMDLFGAYLGWSFK